jgi:hypothetical protein
MGTMMLLRLVQFAKAEAPIVVMLPGISMLDIVAFSKPFAVIVVTGRPL